MDFARSPLHPDREPQSYADHIRNVESGALARFLETGGKSEVMGESLRLSALFHDLGKLLEENQKILSKNERMEALPYDHTDAGVAALLASKETVPAVLVWSHHRGLPNCPAEYGNTAPPFRSSDEKLRSIVDDRMADLLERHVRNGIPGLGRQKGDRENQRQLTLRILLSCLTDSDRTDAAEFDYGKDTAVIPDLKPEERLNLLVGNIARLNAEQESQSDDCERRNERNYLRKMLLENALASENPGIVSLSALVGSGKTFAGIAHLLKIARQNNLRRIFYVAPFTNLIDQTVETLRANLVLPGESPEEIVVAHHHRIQFDSPRLRRYSINWRAPVIVTTAVQFFETMAAHHPADLRKFHQVPRSGVFVDEAHATMPIWFWKQAWPWMKELAYNWGCRFVLASGTQVRFWELEDLGLQIPKCGIPELASEKVQNALEHYEKGRITVRSRSENLDEDEFAEWAASFRMPSIFVFNTVNNAARAALAIEKKFGRRSNVEHLSTALAPKDREDVIGRIKRRLNDSSDTSWVLTATSCVESGMNFSFRSGGRELSSLSSLLQTDGRINREGESASGAEIWSFSLKIKGAENGFSSNPGFADAARVLKKLLEKGYVSPEMVTESLRKEIGSSIGEDHVRKVCEDIRRCENSGDFPAVSRLFKLVRNLSLTVVINPNLAERIRNGKKVSPEEIQKNSVSISVGDAISPTNEIQKIIPKRFTTVIRPFENGNAVEGTVYEWLGKYDNFLGYMAEFLKEN